MGLRSSKTASQEHLQLKQDQKIEYLEKRIAQLEFYNNQILDKLATYREIEIKVDECYEKIGLDKSHKHQKYVIKTEVALNDAKKKIIELEKQLELLNELHKKNNIGGEYTLPCINNNTDKAITLNALSKKQIELLVNKLLADEQINIKYFPDWVERQLYINVINLVVNLLEQFLSGTNINMLGHSIGFTLTPLPISDE